MRLTDANTKYIEKLRTWFPDQRSILQWGGPGFRFPATPESFREDAKLDQLPSRVLLNSKDELVGFGQYYLRQGHCHVGRLVISPAHRGQQLGETLIKLLCDEGSAAVDSQELSLFVLSDNIPAIRLYNRLGYTKAVYRGTDLDLTGMDYMTTDLSILMGN